METIESILAEYKKLPPTMCFVNLEGQVASYIQSSVLNQYVIGETYNDHIAQLWDSSIQIKDVSDIHELYYWDFDANNWSAREPAPNHFYIWKNKQWVLNSELYIGQVKMQRNQLLSESDWTQLADIVLSDVKKEEWRLYRQALRDFPSTISEATDFDNLAWPVKPEM